MTHANRETETTSEHLRARELDEALRSCVRKQIAIDAKIAVMLAEMQAGKLWRQLNCTSLTDYGRRVLGYSSTKTSDLLQIGRRKDLPELIGALEEGAFGYKVAAEIARVATPEDVKDWIQKGQELRLSELKAEARGEDPRERVVLDLLQEEFRAFDSGIEFVRKGGGPWEVGAIVALVFKDFLERHAQGGAQRREKTAPRNDRYRIHVDVCAECGRASQETSRGAMAIGRGELERLRCDAEVLDLREGARGRVTRTIPSRVRNYVWGRDRGTCQVPGCGLRGGIDIHHLDLWWTGHEPGRMLVLCGEHHDQVHEELLRIDGWDGEWRFWTRDGLPLRGNLGLLPLGDGSGLLAG